MLKKKRLVITILLFGLTFSYVYTQQVRIVKDSTYCRYIFPKEYPEWLAFPTQKERYTPSVKDALLAENILQKNLDYLKRGQEQQNGLPPYIYRNLGFYDRQYFGFINQDKEKVLFVNFIWYNMASSQELSKDLIYFLDGGNYYWSIFININRKTLYAIKVNGVS
jgi:hypothetical protein